MVQSVSSVMHFSMVHSQLPKLSPPFFPPCEQELVSQTRLIFCSTVTITFSIGTWCRCESDQHCGTKRVLSVVSMCTSAQPRATVKGYYQTASCIKGKGAKTTQVATCMATSGFCKLFELYHSREGKLHTVVEVGIMYKQRSHAAGIQI